MAATSTPHHRGNPSAHFDPDRRREMIIPSRDLNIVWGNDTRYWSISEEKSAPVELHQVSWLEVTCAVDETWPDRNYEVGFRVSFNPDAFGWGNCPVYVMVKRGKHGKIAFRKHLIHPNMTGMFEITGEWTKSDLLIQDVHDYKLADDYKLYFGLYEVWSGKWKGGLKIYSATVREFN